LRFTSLFLSEEDVNVNTCDVGTTCDAIGATFANTAGFLYLMKFDEGTPTSVGPISLVSGSQYYAVLAKSGNTVTLTVYSDSAHTNSVGSINIDVSTVTGLRYVMHSNHAGETAGSYNMFEVDNISVMSP